jgi:hypothetical protein
MVTVVMIDGREAAEGGDGCGDRGDWAGSVIATNAIRAATTREFERPVAGNECSVCSGRTFAREAA